MVICLAGLTVSSTLFGFSTYIWQMIATRGMAGVFSGCLGTMRVMLGEITTEDNRAEAYSIWATASSLGTLLAPVAGGLPARPLDHYGLFRDVQIFEKYPYLLPSLLMGLLGGGATIVAILFLKEIGALRIDGSPHLLTVPTDPYTRSQTRHGRGRNFNGGGSALSVRATYSPQWCLVV